MNKSKHVLLKQIAKDLERAQKVCLKDPSANELQILIGALENAKRMAVNARYIEKFGV